VKKIKRICVSGLIAMLALGAGAVNATPALFDYGFNIDGSLTFSGDATPAGLDDTLFNYTDGLGQIDITVTGTGAHNVIGWFDHEIDESINTFFNESGATGGAAAAGQSWEIDEPGFVFGDIFDNWQLNTLDNSNGVPAGLEDDVSMATGWNFSLLAGETAVVSLFLDTVNNAPGFFLQHYDPDSDESVFLWSSLTITGQPPVTTGVPEPGTLGLFLGLGLISLVASRRRRPV
jgi:hypothetical protein